MFALCRHRGRCKGLRKPDLLGSALSHSCFVAVTVSEDPCGLQVFLVSKSDSVVDVYLPQAFVFIQPWKYQELLVQRFIHFSFHHFICIENQTKDLRMNDRVIEWLNE